jgi:hypothetical protein
VSTITSIGLFAGASGKTWTVVAVGSVVTVAGVVAVAGAEVGVGVPLPLALQASPTKIRGSNSQNKGERVKCVGWI